MALARAKAPQRRRGLGWTGGLATAAVLVVAVYLTNLGDSTRIAPAPEKMALPEQGRTADNLSAEAAMGAAQRVQATSKMRMAEEIHREADMAVSADAPRPQLIQETESFAAAAAMPLQADEAVAEKGRSTQPAEESLRHIRDLVAAGQQELAEEAYAQLLIDCAECGLPETLDQALETLPSDDQ